MEEIRVATLNVRGLSKPGKWHEVEDWVRRKKVDIQGLEDELENIGEQP